MWKMPASHSPNAHTSCGMGRFVSYVKIIFLCWFLFFSYFFLRFPIWLHNCREKPIWLLCIIIHVDYTQFSIVAVGEDSNANKVRNTEQAE